MIVEKFVFVSALKAGIVVYSVLKILLLLGVV